MPNVLSPRDIDSRPDNMDETIISYFLTYFTCISMETIIDIFSLILITAGHNVYIATIFNR